MATFLRSLLAALALALAGVGPVNADEAAIQYGCDELVVVGRPRTAGYTDLSGDADLVGHGRFDMQVRIKRVLRGSEPRRAVPASGIAHAQMREDVDFLLVLTPGPGGGYVVREARLPPYKLAKACGQGR